MSLFSVARAPIDIVAAKRALEDPACGACVCFEGWVRNHNEGRPAVLLEYEIFEELALKEGTKIVEEATERYGVAKIVCIHRVGPLLVGDMAIWVGVSSGHRGESFAACRYIVDEVKHRVPIWKKEHDGSGAADWVNCAVSHDQRPG